MDATTEVVVDFLNVLKQLLACLKKATAISFRILYNSSFNIIPLLVIYAV
jgi:hypothetical protein